MRYIFTFLIGGTAGAFMTLAGLSLSDWQYWGILACVVGMYCLGSWERRMDK
jgi:hypothetical protein